MDISQQMDNTFKQQIDNTFTQQNAGQPVAMEITVLWKANLTLDAVLPTGTEAEASQPL